MKYPFTGCKKNLFKEFLWSDQKTTKRTPKEAVNKDPKIFKRDPKDH